MLVKFKNYLSVACNSKLFFLKLVHECDLLKPTFRVDLRRNVLLYYLQVGGMSV